MAACRGGVSCFSWKMLIRFANVTADHALPQGATIRVMMNAVPSVLLLLRTKRISTLTNVERKPGYDASFH
jgi:hypothetical protein